MNQGVLTPTTGDIVAHVFSSLEKYMARKATPAFIEWLANKSSGYGKINCSIVDFAENVDYVSTVMQLNMLFVSAAGAAILYPSIIINAIIIIDY